MLSRENCTSADPLTLLEFCKGEIDRLFGCGLSRDPPELHGLTIARAVQDVAAALLVEETASGNGLLRPPAILR